MSIPDAHGYHEPPTDPWADDHDPSPYARPSSNGQADDHSIWEKYDGLYLPRSALADMDRGEPLIDGVIDAHALGGLTGRDHTYKSFLTLDWLCCLATGKPWFGRTVKRTKSLYVIGEGAWGLHDRICAWEAAWAHDVDDDWLHIRRAPVNLFRRVNDFADLLRRIEAERYGLVFFDTLQKMTTGAEGNSAKDAGQVLEALAQVRDATTEGAAWYVAHTDKGDNDTRGSSVYEDDIDIVWHLRRDADEEVIHAELTKRKDGPEGLHLELRPEQVKGTGSLVLQRGTSLLPEQRTPPKQAYPVLRLLASPVHMRGASASALAEALGLKGKGSVHNALNWLIGRDYVTDDKRGQWPAYQITDTGTSALDQVADQR